MILVAFAPGILIAGLQQRGWLSARWSGLAPLGLAGLVLVLACSGAIRICPDIANYWTEGIARTATIVSAGLVLLFIAEPPTASRWGLNISWLRWLGLVSYEWYLLHYPLFFVVWRSMGLADGSISKYLTKTCVPILGSLLLSAFIYRFYSLPILRRNRN